MAPGTTSGDETSVSSQICTAEEANTSVNKLATYIAQFIPRENQAEMLFDQYGIRIHHANQPALAHILAELVENEFLGVLITRYGPRVLDRIEFKNCHDEVQAAARFVTHIRARDYDLVHA